MTEPARPKLLAHIPGALPLIFSPGWAFRVSTILTLTAGSACLMWISDELTGRRIGDVASQAITTGFERRYGVLKRLAAAGMSRPQLIAGKAVAAVVVVATLLDHSVRYGDEIETQLHVPVLAIVPDSRTAIQPLVL